MLEKQFGSVKKKARLSRGAHCKKLSPLAETGLLAVQYSLTLLTGFVDKRAHAALALVFTFLTATHVYTRRRLL